MVWLVDEIVVFKFGNTVVSADELTDTDGTAVILTVVPENTVPFVPFNNTVGDDNAAIFVVAAVSLTDTTCDTFNDAVVLATETMVELDWSSAADTAAMAKMNSNLCGKNSIGISMWIL